MNYNERIRALREDADMKQSEVAAIVGTSQSYYAQYENGHRPIPFDRIVTLAEFYGVSLDWIAGRSDVKEVK